MLGNKFAFPFVIPFPPNQLEKLNFNKQSNKSLKLVLGRNSDKAHSVNRRNLASSTLKLDLRRFYGIDATGSYSVLRNQQNEAVLLEELSF